jgi:WD40 repeat protein
MTRFAALPLAVLFALAPAPLLGQPAAEQQARTDLYGDPLPDGAVARMGTQRLCHGAMVNAVVFTPDGRGLLSAGFDGRVILSDPSTGKRLREYYNRGGFRSVAVSPDGKTVAAAGYQGSFRVWDLATGKELAACDSGEAEVVAVAFSPDGKRLASCGMDGMIRTFDPVTGKPIGAWLAEVRPEYPRMRFSPDGKVLASMDGGRPVVSLWDPITGAEVRRLERAQMSLSAIGFTPDSERLIAAYEGVGGLGLWEVKTGKLLKDFGHNGGVVWGLAITPDANSVFAAGLTGQCRRWDLATGKLVRQFQAGQRAVKTLALSPDGQVLASGGNDQVVRLWDAATGKELSLTDRPSEATQAVCFTPDGKGLYTGNRDGWLRLWEVNSGRQLQRIHRVADAATCLVLAPDGSTLAATGVVLQQSITGQPANVSIHFLDTATGRELRSLPGEAHWVGGLAFSPDGKLLASLAKGALRLRDAQSGRDARTLEAPAAKNAYTLAFSPDGAFLAARKEEQTVGIWSVASGKVVREWPVTESSDVGLLFTPDGKRLIGGGNREMVAIWDVATGKLRGRFEGPPAYVYALALSPDGRTLAVAIDAKRVRLWSLATGQRLGEFTAQVDSLAFSRDGTFLATGDLNGSALVWDMRRLQRPKGEADRRPPEVLWAELGEEDPERVYQAFTAFIANAERTVPWLTQRLAPIGRPHAETLTRLIADLDASDFAAREKATAELGRLADLAEPALRIVLVGQPSAEVRRRVERLLDAPMPPGQLQELRAVEVLEAIGTPAARRLLEALARGTEEARLTRDSTAALQRLGQRPTPMP